MPIMHFFWLGASYNPASQVLELFRFGSGYETFAATYRQVRLPAPPEIMARKLGMGWGWTNNPSAQVSAAMFWERRLTYEEMKLIATTYTPPVFIHGNFPFHFTDVPRTCPSGGASFPFTLYLPHTYGGAVTVAMSSSAGGSFSPPNVTWATPTTPEGSRKVGYTFTCVCAPTGTTTFNLVLSGDTAHYWLPKTSFQVTQLDPSAVAIFRLDVAAASPAAATKDAVYKTVEFDGWSQYLSQCTWKNNSAVGVAAASAHSAACVLPLSLNLFHRFLCSFFWFVLFSSLFFASSPVQTSTPYPTLEWHRRALPPSTSRPS